MNESVVTILSEKKVTQAPARRKPSPYVIERFGTSPVYPDGPVRQDTQQALEIAFGDNLKAGNLGIEQSLDIEAPGSSGDPRMGWLTVI